MNTQKIRQEASQIVLFPFSLLAGEIKNIKKLQHKNSRPSLVGGLQPDGLTIFVSGGLFLLFLGPLGQNLAVRDGGKIRAIVKAHNINILTFQNLISLKNFSFHKWHGLWRSDGKRYVHGHPSPPRSTL
jgi:hypothetical protein